MTSPVSIRTTFIKNDGVRSCLIELQSFHQSKVDVDPIHRIFDVSSMLYACIVQDGVLPSRSCQDPYGFRGELGGTELFLMNQYNTEIYSCFLLLLPCCSSTYYQTNDDNTRNKSEDCLSFSRIELLHRLLGVDFHDEEDESMCLTLHNRRLNILLGSTSVQVLYPKSIVLVDEPAEPRLCGFALAFDRLAKSPAFNLNAYSSNCISEVSCSLLFKFVTNLFKP